MKTSFIFSCLAAFGLALAAGCAASTSPDGVGAQGIGGETGEPGTTGDDAGAPAQEHDGGIESKRDGGDTTKDGSTPPVTDGSTPPTLDGRGITVSVNGQTYHDADAVARRDKHLSGPNAGSFSGSTYVPTSPVLLSQIYKLTFSMNPGGSGYLHTGTYPCSLFANSQTPIGRSHLSVLFPTGEGWVAGDYRCFVNVDVADATGAGGKWRVRGTIGGKLLKGSDKSIEEPVSGSFDLDYEN